MSLDIMVHNEPSQPNRSLPATVYRLRFCAVSLGLS